MTTNEITLREAATRAGLSVRAIRSAAARGALKARKIHEARGDLWLTTPEAVDAYLATRRVAWWQREQYRATRHNPRREYLDRVERERDGRTMPVQAVNS